MRIFIAGATGAVGQPMTRLLLHDQHQLFAISRSEQKVQQLQALGIAAWKLDVFEREALITLLQEIRPDLVIHQLTDLPPGLEASKMAEGLERTARLRDQGTNNLIAAAIAGGAQRLIAQSIAFVYAPKTPPYTEDDPLDLQGKPSTVSAVQSLERQVLVAPLQGLVLRYGQFYGPNTGFDTIESDNRVHVHAAADAARRATLLGASGIYNIADDTGLVDISRATSALAWSPHYRLPDAEPRLLEKQHNG
jgi:nucleoside-diphosphate-sugar epimerase